MVSEPQRVIRLASPDVTGDDIERAVEVLQSGHLVQGAAVARLEQALEEFTGMPSVVVSSGTAALHLALLALDMGTGDGVVVPAFTFPATANAVERAGAKVLFCDVEADTYVTSVSQYSAVLSANPGVNIRAVIPVSEFGCPVDTRAIAKLVPSKVRVVEDAACALGTMSNGSHAGTYADAACLSFHPRKAITTGEGGAVLSRDGDFLERIRRLRNHGMERASADSDFVDAGLNYRLTDFQAALAPGQLARFPAQLELRRALADQYRDRLGSVAGIRLPRDVPGHAWQTFMVVLDKTIDRDAVRGAMRDNGIETNLGAQALNCLSYFQRRYGVTESSFPIAASLYRQGLALPIHGKLSAADVAFVCDTLRDVLFRLQSRPADTIR